MACLDVPVEQVAHYLALVYVLARGGSAYTLAVTFLYGREGYLPQDVSYRTALIINEMLSERPEHW
jgi:hypothetical protein